MHVLLHGAGVPDEQLSIRASGEFEPLEGVPADAHENRRVEIRVDEPDSCRSEG